MVVLNLATARRSGDTPPSLETGPGFIPRLERKDMKPRSLILALGLVLPLAAPAAENPAVVKAMEEYMDFTEYGSSIIWPEQIPAEDWKKVFVIDARDAAQYAREHIPGAAHIEWRQAIARRGEIPRDRTVVYYCNTGSLSAQAVYALRLLGWDNVKVLQDGIEGWKKKGGFRANELATESANKPAGH
jgi:rhodanese-related sulfurtransferase